MITDQSVSLRDICWRSAWSSPQCKSQSLKTVVQWCYLHLIHWLKTIRI